MKPTALSIFVIIISQIREHTIGEYIIYHWDLILMYPCIVDDSVETLTRCSFVIEFIIPKFIEGSTCFERHMW